MRRPPASRLAVPALLVLSLLAIGAGGQEGAWRLHTPLSDQRSEVAAATARGEIVVVGGFIGTGANSARVDAYSVAGDTWRRLPDLPVAVDHASAASTGGRIYVAGGYGPDRKPLRAAFVLDDGAWRRLPLMPDGRAAAAAAIAAGRLYVVGGRNSRRLLAKDAFALTLGARSWKRIPGPSPREHLAAAASRDRVYAVGGRAAGIDSNTTDFQVYDSGARRWQRLTPLPGARGGTGAAAIGGRIVSVGGEETAGTIASVYAYSVDTKRWSRLADLPTPRHGLGVVAAGNRVWAIAGGPVPGLTVSGAIESLEP